MLILSRKAGEMIRIGNDVTITVCRITGNKVRLGIEAPHNVKVLRSEVEIELPKEESHASPIPTKSRVSTIPPLSGFFTTTAFAGA